MSKLSVTIIFLSILFLLFTHAPAIMRGMSTEELTIESDMVVQGEVKNVRTYWSKDGESIISRAVIIKQNFIKGMFNRKNLVIEYEGGEIGDIGLRVSDVAPLIEGEQVLLFLRVGISEKEGEVFHIVGKGQGKYVIGVDGIARKGGFSAIEGQELIDNNIPIDDLIDRIQNAH